MLSVMVSGHFDPFHYAHLDYIKQAAVMGDYLICVVSSDRQVIMKKGKVNEPESERAEIMSLILKGLGINGRVVVNTWDTYTTQVAITLRRIKPDIFCRGTDKILNDMPWEEREICYELGIRIAHAEGKIAHGSTFV